MKTADRSEITSLHRGHQLRFDPLAGVVIDWRIESVYEIDGEWLESKTRQVRSDLNQIVRSQ
ncbi:hypothetical protein A5N77_03230 [Prescottella equi]|nr:hypothetical protein A5N77_03230 [Prescottella equi]